MPGEGKVWGQMRYRRCLAGAAFEIHPRNDLQRFALAPLRQIALKVRAAVLIQILSQLKHPLGGAGAAT